MDHSVICNLLLTNLLFLSCHKLVMEHCFSVVTNSLWSVVYRLHTFTSFCVGFLLSESTWYQTLPEVAE